MSKKPGQLWIRLAVLLSVMGISACSKSAHFSQSKNRETIPTQYSSALDLLDYLKDTVTGGYPVPVGVDDKRWDVEKVLSYISKNGLTLYEGNGESTVKFDRRSVKDQLTKKRGQAYDLIAHMGHIYSQPYSQYCQLTYETVRNGIVINMADWYELTFVLEGNVPRLSRLEYLAHADD